MAVRPSGTNFHPLKITGLKLDGTPRSQISLNTEVAECNMANRSSPKFSSNGREGRCVAEYWLNTDDTDYAASCLQGIKDFIGYSEAVLEIPQASPAGTAAVPTGINRFIPYPHPSSPNYLYSESVQNIEGDVPTGTDANDVGTYDEAKASVIFGSRDYVIGDNGINNESLLQQYVTIIPETTGRYERVPALGYLAWQDRPYSDPGIVGGTLLPAPNAAGEIISNAAAVILCEGEVTINWWQIPIEAIPWPAINDCVGKCDLGVNIGGTYRYKFLLNSYLGPVFNPTPGGRYEPNFICMTPKFSKPYQMVNGKYAVDIAYKFKYYPFGANSFYRWRTGRFEEAGIKGAIQPSGRLQGFYKPFFKEADFLALFFGTST